MERDPFYAEVTAFQTETGISDYALCRKAQVDNTAIFRMRDHGARPNGTTRMKLRAAMASYRAEIAERMAQAQRDGAAAAKEGGR